MEGKEVRPVRYCHQRAGHGRCIGLLGPNGAGKSTLINTLLGFYPVSHGTARIFGRDIRTDLHVLRHRIGFMPENDSFIADMSGVQFVRYMAELSGLPPGQALERSHEAFFYVGLGEARYRKLGTYSLGMTTSCSRRWRAYSPAKHRAGTGPPTLTRLRRLFPTLHRAPGSVSPG